MARVSITVFYKCSLSWDPIHSYTKIQALSHVFAKLRKGSCKHFSFFVDLYAQHISILQDLTNRTFWNFWYQSIRKTLENGIRKIFTRSLESEIVMLTLSINFRFNRNYSQIYFLTCEDSRSIFVVCIFLKYFMVFVRMFWHSLLLNERIRSRETENEILK